LFFVTIFWLLFFMRTCNQNCISSRPSVALLCSHRQSKRPMSVQIVHSRICNSLLSSIFIHTHPKLLAHQYGAHIRCLNQFICSGWAYGWAYGTIGNPKHNTFALVVPDFDSRLKAWVTAGLHKPYHYAVVEAPYPSKAACTSMWSTYKVFEPLHMQWMGIWNHWQPVTTIAHVDPDFDSRLKAWVTAGLQTIPLCSG
jgi:hypothetical protein